MIQRIYSEFGSLARRKLLERGTLCSITQSLFYDPSELDPAHLLALPIESVIEVVDLPVQEILIHKSTEDFLFSWEPDGCSTDEENESDFEVGISPRTLE